MTLLQAIALFIAAVLGGMLNSVAGGGSFITFPTLLIAGVASKSANATSTIALWPGSVASIWPYRKSLDASRSTLLILGSASLLGGILGANLLLHTPNATFRQMVPYLLLLATLLFTFGGEITKRLPKREMKGAKRGPLMVAAMALLQLVIATYGGFFGGGIGILMLAGFAAMGMENIHSMNALKAILASCINGVAVVTFIIAGIVVWPQALVMIGGAIVGGYGGATIARRLDPRLVRRFVIAVGFIMTIYFFVRP